MKRHTGEWAGLPFAGILAAWALVAFAWTPAVAFVSTPEPTASVFVMSLAMCAATFLPWAVATPALFKLCLRVPVGEGRNTSSLLALALFGLLIIPSLTLFAPLLRQFGALIWPDILGAPHDLQQFLRQMFVTSLFAVPTYVAVIAVGQTLVWANRARVEESHSVRAQLRALRAELNPHFLMNALGSIAQIARSSTDRAEAALVSLANILRDGLAVKGEYHTLADEIGAVEERLALYRALHGSLDFKRKVADSIWHRLVPSHILIPLVENALTHGAVTADAKPVLSIEARGTSTATHLIIRNPLPHEARVSQGLNSGIEQVRQRLDILYAGTACITILTHDNWFSITLAIPHD